MTADPPRLHYATDYEGIGNAFGYAVHNAETRRALGEAGVVFDANAPVAFHVASPIAFRPVPGKTNVLYVAWETDRLPESYAQKIRHADALVVTAPFLRPIFERAAPGTPVHVAPLGVDTAAFPFRARRVDRRKPFRFLWVGAPNARKGFELLLAAWRLFEGRSDMELYLKTTVTDALERRGNVIFDSRRLSRAALVELYHSAHAFVFPSFGEGFGLTLFEALATGCPALWTDWSAPADLLRPGGALGYPLPYAMIETPLGRVAQAELASLVRGMLRLREDYASGKAARKARRAARHVRRTLGWERTARRLLQILPTIPSPSILR